MKIFWAWQFDLKAKVARTFIREALEEAIAAINQTQDIDEPDESFQSGGLQLDFGREGLKGSPDLAIEIQKKIDNADVFVGDVTPVGKTELSTTDENVTSEKMLMNPNVAIELGYALKSLDTDRVLMIMNAHYGKRADMPFDLGHKGGPIMYTLAPDASRGDIEREKKKLVAVLVDALGMYVPKPAFVPFEEMKPQIGQGIFFRNGEALGENKNGPDKGRKFVMSARRVMWLRLYPIRPLPMPMSEQTIRNHLPRVGSFGAPVGMEGTRENAYGFAYFSWHDNEIDSITQCTRDGEVWGINVDYLRQGEDGERRYIFSLPIENQFIQSMRTYCEYMQKVVKAVPPIQAEAGIEGIKGAELQNHGFAYGVTRTTMHRDSVVHRATLRTYDEAEQNAFLETFLKKLHANAGVERKANLYGRW